MGIISSFLGDRPSTPQTGGFTVGAEIPDELKPYYKDILGKSQALYNESVSQGYKPYTGPSIAEFTPEQQQAFTGLSGLQGGAAPVFQEAMQMTRDAAAPITTEQITEYMNPYQQAVVDIEKREATKQYQSQVVPQLAAQATRIQPFGGSRQAILEGMAADTQQRLLGDIQAKGSAQSYQDAVNLLNNQRATQGTAAGQLATMAPNQFKTQIAKYGALQGVGEEKQKLSQQALNEAYGQYLKEQEYPYQQLGKYQSVVTGAPISGREYVPPVEQPSAVNQLLGGLGTLGSTYGAFGGFSPGGFMGTNKPASTGGGISQLPVIKRQQNGSVYDTDPEFGYNTGQANINLPQEGVNTLTNPQLIALEEKRKRDELLNANRNRKLFTTVKDFFTDDDRAAAIMQLQDESGSTDPNVLKLNQLKKMARNEPPYAGPHGTVMEGGLNVTPQDRLNKYGIPITETVGMSDIPRLIKESKLNKESKIVKSEIVETPEVDPAIAIAAKKAKDLERLRKAQIDNTAAQKKAKADPDKTDKPDIYADATAAEDAYLLALKKKEKRLGVDIKDLKWKEREAQFGNLAMMFARLGTKSGPLLSALIESTGEILPAALKTKNEFAKEGRRLKVAVEDAQLGELKTTADIKKSRAGLKSKTAQQALENELAKKEVEIKEKDAETKRLKVENPKLKDYKPYNKSSLDGIGEEVNSFLFKGDVEDIKANSPELYNILKSRKFNAGDKLADTEIDNFVKKLSNDPFARQQIYKNVELAGRIAAANTDQSFDQATATRKAIVDFLSTREALNIYNSGVVTDRLSF